MRMLRYYILFYVLSEAFLFSDTMDDEKRRMKNVLRYAMFHKSRDEMSFMKI